MPVLPYGGTEGHSGTDTSRERAEREALSASERQQTVLDLAAQWREDGVTVDEVRKGGIPHHGSASATLSVLHQGGSLVRLVEKRGGCKVYVLPEHVAGRPFEKFVGNREKAQIEALEEASETIRILLRKIPRASYGLNLAYKVLQRQIAKIRG